MATNDSKYLPELMAEKDSIDPSFVHAVRLICEEIKTLENPEKKEESQKKEEKVFRDVLAQKFSKVECDIRIPAEEHPSINFVGRLIGPKGSTMKAIQELTNTRIAVLGKGSVRERDRKKVEDDNRGDDKLAHLQYPLHVHVSSMAPLPQAYVNLGRACAEIQKLLQVDEDTEAQFAAAQGMIPGGNRGFRGGVRGGRGMGRGRGRSGFGQRGTGSGGAGGSQRGTIRGGGRGMRGGGRGQQSYMQMAAAAAAAEAYTEDYGYDSFTGAGAYDTSGYDDSYGTGFDTSYAAEAAAYGDCAYGDSYDNIGFGNENYDYGNGSATSQTGSFTSQGSYRGKMAGNRGGVRGRQKPY